MPVQADFTLVRYEDGLITVGLTPPVAVTNWNIAFDVSRRFGNETQLLTKSCASGYNNVSGINITNTAQGIFNISMKSVDTSGWDPGNYAYQVTRKDSGYRTVLTQGYILLAP